MRVEVINTGTEILLGHVTNTHLGYLAKSLFELGLRVEWQVTVPDGVAIRVALEEAINRSDLILVTGGLGPTSDDVTREIAAELFSRKMIFHPEVLEKIRERFAKRHLVMGEIVKRQAYAPEGAVLLANDHGTAPGLILDEKGKTLVFLPGPPRELKPMWENEALPWLKAHRLQERVVHHRQWRIIGVGESAVQERIEEELRTLGEMEIGYCARSGEVDLRVIVQEPKLLDRAAEKILTAFGEAIYTEGTRGMEAVVIDLARQKGLKIATAESCTGGLVGHRLTNVPGSSDVFGFGWIAYANEAKVRELGVSEELLKIHGAVSREVVEAMASGAMQQSGADVAVAVSGIAGPGGGTPEKPVGMAWFAIATKRGVHSWEKRLSQDREVFKSMAAQAALDGLRRTILEF